MNKSTLINALIFTAGAAVGSFVTWLAVKDKYKKQADADIREAREYYKNKNESKSIEEKPKATIIEDKAEEEPEDENEKVAAKYRARALNYNYNRVSHPNDEDEDEGIVNPDGEQPYLIEFEDVGELDMWTEEELTYYSDGYLADIHDNVKAINETIGYELLDALIDSDDDTIYVRNEQRMIDYTVTKIPDKYIEVVGGTDD